MCKLSWWCPDAALNQMTRAHEDDAGFDVCTIADCRVPAHGSAVAGTGLYVAVCPGYVAKVCSRSGNSFKHGIEVGAGVIDAGYRGEVKIVLYNHSSVDHVFNRGDRVAQLLILPCEDDIRRVASIEELGIGSRGAGGFGSSGN